MAIIVLGVGVQNDGSSDSAYMYTQTGGGWEDKSQRRITFLEEPTGDFLVWLESNATKETDKSDN